MLVNCTIISEKRNEDMIAYLLRLVFVKAFHWNIYFGIPPLKGNFYQCCGGGEGVLVCSCNLYRYVLL